MPDSNEADSKQSGRCDGWPVLSWRTLSAFNMLQRHGVNLGIYWLCSDEGMQQGNDERKKHGAIKVMKQDCKSSLHLPPNK